jgi:hypothetical protein
MMRRLQDAPSQGAPPPHPRDICFQYESGQVFHTGKNIPAGGCDLGHHRNGAERSAQNSCFKNFVGQGTRR